MHLGWSRSALLVGIFAAAHPARALVRTVAGGGAGDGLPALQQSTNPTAIASDAEGNLFFYDVQLNRLRRVDAATGIISTVATGDAAGCGTGPRAPLECEDTMLGDLPAAQNPRPGLAVDAAGRLLVANGVVRRIDTTTGDVTVMAGNGEAAFCGDGGPATEACMDAVGVALDAAGNLFIADAANERVRRVDASTGNLTTVAGRGLQLTCGDGGPATEACLDPAGVAVDAAGNLYVLDTFDERVRRVDAVTQAITTVACGSRHRAPCDGPLAYMLAFTRMALDGQGRPLLSVGVLLQRVDPGAKTVEELACPSSTFGPDCVLPFVACESKLPSCFSSSGVTVDAHDRTYVASGSARRIVTIDLTTITATLAAGNGKSDFCGDGGPATNACVTALTLARDANGLYLGEGDPAGFGRVRRVDPITGKITTITGDGFSPLCEPGETDPTLCLGPPGAVLPDGAGGLLIADYSRGRVRRLDLTTGALTTIARYVPASDLAFDARGDLLILSVGGVVGEDGLAGQVVRFDPATNQVVTVAGNGTQDVDCVDGLPANLACLSPTSIAVAPSGDLFISEPRFLKAFNGDVKRVDGTTGLMTTFVAGLRQEFTRDIRVDASGTGLLLAEMNRVDRIDLADGTTTTVAGASEDCLDAEGVRNVHACLTPRGFATDPDGAVLTTTPNGAERRVVRITPDPVLPPGACIDVTDCNDHEPCTIDTCDGHCHHEVPEDGSLSCQFVALEHATPCDPDAVASRLSTVLQKGTARINEVIASLLDGGSADPAAIRKARRVALHLARAARRSRRTAVSCRAGLRRAALSLRRLLAAH